MDLSRTMREALARAGYEAPTPIQGGLIPRAIDGFDVIGQAQTGTGKTAAFAIPIIDMLDPPGKTKHPQALILCPTRELAVQVGEEIRKLSYGTRAESVVVYGGKPIRGQIEKLRRGVEIVVGTPGRVIDHIQRGSLVLSELWCVVLDEADRMLDIGFRPDIEKILGRCPRDRQTMLFSATLPPPILRLAKRYMYEPETLNFSPKEITVETIDQYYFTVENNRKFELLVKLLKREQPQQAIVFCRTKRGTERIFQRLNKKFDGMGCIHGDLQQGARDRVMGAFRAGKLRYLIATDVVGRGIDVTSISHIVNYDTPQLSDDYVHRVGRAGRMGRNGVAYTFVSPDEGSQLTQIEQRINRELVRDDIEGITGMRLAAGDSADAETPKRELPSEMLRRPPKRHRRAL